MGRKVQTPKGTVEFNVVEKKDNVWGYTTQTGKGKPKFVECKSKRNAWASMAKASKALREQHAKLNNKVTRTNPYPNATTAAIKRTAIRQKAKQDNQRNNKREGVDMNALQVKALLLNLVTEIKFGKALAPDSGDIKGAFKKAVGLPRNASNKRVLKELGRVYEDNGQGASFQLTLDSLGVTL